MPGYRSIGSGPEWHCRVAQRANQPLVGRCDCRPPRPDSKVERFSLTIILVWIVTSLTMLTRGIARNNMLSSPSWNRISPWPGC